MPLASDITADLSGIFLTDFATTVNASTWGNSSLAAIFDREYLEFEDASRSTPYLTVRTSDVPNDADTGDLFVVDGTTYKLADVQYAEPGLSRIILAGT